MYKNPGILTCISISTKQTAGKTLKLKSSRVVCLSRRNVASLPYSPRTEDRLESPQDFNPGPLHPPPSGHLKPVRCVCPGNRPGVLAVPLTHCTLPPLRQTLSSLGSEQRCHPRGAALHVKMAPSRLPSPGEAHRTSARVRVQVACPRGPCIGTQAGRPGKRRARHDASCPEEGNPKLWERREGFRGIGPRSGPSRGRKTPPRPSEASRPGAGQLKRSHAADRGGGDRGSETRRQGGAEAPGPRVPWPEESMFRRRPGHSGGRGQGLRRCRSRAGRTRTRSSRTHQPAEPPQPPRHYVISDATARFRFDARSAFIPPPPAVSNEALCGPVPITRSNLIGQGCGRSRKGRPGCEGIPPTSAPPARHTGRKV